MTLAWITGAGGFIGGHLARLLVAEGQSVAGIGFGDAAHCPVFVAAAADAAGFDALAQRTGPPDIVYHLAGGASVGLSLADPARDFARTVPGTADLLEWIRLRAPAARLIAISSAAVYGAGHTGPIPEESALAPQSPYGVHKLAMELLCRSYASSFGIEVAIVRPFSVYGPGLRKQLLWELCTRCATYPDRIELQGDGRELRDWIHVGDVARGLSRIATGDWAGVRTLNLGTGRGVDVAEIARCMLACWDMPADILSFSGVNRPGDPKSLVADVARLSAIGLGRTVAIEAGIAEYAAWCRAAIAPPR